jgi:hypothetical protein
MIIPIYTLSTTSILLCVILTFPEEQNSNGMSYTDRCLLYLQLSNTAALSTSVY